MAPGDEPFLATASQIESLKNAFFYDLPPLCSGTVSPPPEGLYLYYGKEDSSFINFASSTPEQLDQLAAACDPATFGRGKQDVYDESYRKALKMDATNFAVQFDPAASGLIKTIQSNLFRRQMEDMSIVPQIYKLNVYGKDSFFKAHKDTPRGTDMFGSLVIVYPTPHQGGELVLRHKDREWTFDANRLTSSQRTPSLAYVAFYSDIEHEVLKITSGSRVTITYNLFLVPQNLHLRSPGSSHSYAASVRPDIKEATNFQGILHQLLQKPEFMPDGGTLALKLVHLYPVTFKTDLQKTIRYLKGEDAHVYQSCWELGLKPALRMIYSERGTSLYDDKIYWPNFGVMMETIVDGLTYNYESTNYIQHLLDELDGVPVNLTNNGVSDNSDYARDAEVFPEQLTWLSDFIDSANELKDHIIAYGNEVTLGCVYLNPCLIIPIPPVCDRT